MAGKKKRKSQVYPDWIKEKAYEWFMKGYGYSWIAKWIKNNTEFETCRHTTIRNWAESKESGTSWVEERAEKATQAIALRQEETDLDLPARSKAHLEIYQKMQEEGRNAIEVLPIESAKDAADIMDKGVKGERSVASGLVSVVFIRKVIEILTEEINDEDILGRIASRLKVLAVQELQDRSNG